MEAMGNNLCIIGALKDKNRRNKGGNSRCECITYLLKNELFICWSHVPGIKNYTREWI